MQPEVFLFMTECTKDDDQKTVTTKHLADTSSTVVDNAVGPISCSYTALCKEIPNKHTDF